MARFALRRLLTFPLLLLAVYAAAVLLLMATPGDVIDAGGKDLPPEVLAAKRSALNFDQPWLQRYFWTWPKRLIWDQDLPAARYEDWTVVDILRSALPVSLQLGTLALTLAVALGLAVGIVSAVRPGSVLDLLSVGLCLVGISLPTFVVGSLLLIVVGLWLRWAPVGGWGGLGSAILPAITLCLPYAAYIARLTRASLLDAYQDDYIRTARAKGLSPVAVLFDHALRNALLPVLGYLGPAAASIFTGSFVVERLFTIPGMGTHVVEAINNRDQTLILATVLVYSALLATFNLAVDLLYGIADPRIRLGQA